MLAVAGAGLSGFATAAPAEAAARHVALRATLSPSATADPALNVTPSPDYWGTCLQNGANSQTCINTVVAAIDNARALEGVPPMVLPSGFAALSPAEQTFVVSNLERVDRGLQPAIGMVDSLNTLAATAAAANADPVLPSWTVGPFSANRWGSIWAGDLNALASDYDWMYNDGWGPSGSYNLDCTSATASGCWGHRHNILSSYGSEELITGASSVQQSQWLSIAQIFVAGTGPYPAFTRSWSDFAPATATATTTSTAPDSPASGTTAVPLASDATAASLSAPTTVVSGTTHRVTGHVVDASTGTPWSGAAVSLCGRVAGTTTTSCATGTTGATGTVTFSVRPRLTTSYRLTVTAAPGHSAGASTTRVVRVRPALHLSKVRTGSTWRVSASMTPARAQTVRLQRATSAGWVTVRRTTARASMTFTSLRRGTYRLVVSATIPTAGTSASTALR